MAKTKVQHNFFPQPNNQKHTKSTQSSKSDYD